MSYELRAHPLGTLSHGTSTMQPDEEIQYAPRSRPVSFYDNYKVRLYSYVFVYAHISWESYVAGNLIAAWWFEYLRVLAIAVSTSERFRAEKKSAVIDL